MIEKHLFWYNFKAILQATTVNIVIEKNTDCERSHNSTYCGKNQFNNNHTFWIKLFNHK